MQEGDLQEYRGITEEIKVLVNQIQIYYSWSFYLCASCDVSPPSLYEFLNYGTFKCIENLLVDESDGMCARRSFPMYEQGRS